MQYSRLRSSYLGISTLGGQVGEAVEGAGVGTTLTLSAGFTVDSGAVMVHLPSSGFIFWNL
jgi:hypothetical protein